MKKFVLIAVLLLAGFLGISQTIVYQEGFETLPLGVTSSGNPGWARSSKFAKTGVYSDSSRVATADTSYLTTATFSTLASSYVILEFSQICKIEFFDGAVIEVSTNGGTSWTKLTASMYLGAGQFGTQGDKFTAASYTIWDPSNAASIPQNAWWKTETFDISSIASNQADVRVRFKLYDGNNTGHAGNYGWLLDDIKVTVAASELIPPVITLQAPIYQDTVFSTGPFEILALITDASGIDTAYVTYSVNSGSPVNVGMTHQGSNIYSAFLPSQSYNTHVDYQVFAIDASPAANVGQSVTKWFYVKKGPDIVQIGNGTTVNTGTSYPAPYGNYWWGARHQMMLRASELSAAGVTAGEIVSLAFDVVSVGGATLQGFNVKIGQTTQNDMSTWVTTPLTTVFTTPTYTETTGWNTHTFSTPFMWNGTSNIVIETCFNNSSFTTNAVFNQTTTTFVSTIEYHADASGICSSTSLSSTYSQRPNIQLGMAPNLNDYDAGISEVTQPTGTVLAGSIGQVFVRVKNFGLQNLTTAQIGWSVNGVAQTPVPWTGNLTQDQVSNPFNIGQISFAAGPYTIKAWTFDPNGQTDQKFVNDTAIGTAYACNAILSGQYTIGGMGADYPTFADALTALQLCGVNGPVVFNINAGTYAERIVVPQNIPGISSTNTVTFKGLGAATTLFHSTTNSNNRAAVVLDNIKHVRFDSLSIVIPDTATFGWGIFITNQSENIQIKNCSIKTSISSTTTNHCGIVASGSYTGATTTGNTVTDLMISNNTIEGGYYTIALAGETTNRLRKVTIQGNTIKNSYYYGLYLNQMVAPVITKNSIETRVSGTAFTTSSYGMYVANVDSSMAVTKNRLRNLGFYGMYFTACNSASTPILIANNMIGGGFTNTGTPNGIYLGSSSNIALVYNSVNVDKGAGWPLNALSTVSQLSVLNNSFAYTGTGNGYAAYYASTASLTANDYNNYFKNNSNLFVYYGVAVADLAALQAVNLPAGNDANSKVGNPNYSTPLSLYPTGTQLWNSGTPIPGITDDIDGLLRSTTAPCIGAKEYAPPADDAALIAVIAPLNSACGLTTAEDVTIRIKNFGTATMTSVNATYVLNNNTPVTETFTVNIPMDSVQNVTFLTKANLSVYGVYTFNFWVNKTGDVNQLNDSINNYKVYHSHDFYAGPYTQGFEPAQYFADWSVLNPGGGTTTWEIPFNNTTFANSGSNSARFFNGTTNTGEDWLFSRCFNFVAGSTYEVSFFYRNGSTTVGNNIELKMGGQADPVEMDSSLVNLPGILNTTYLKATKTFTVPTTGVYYLGWRAYSAPSTTYAYIDDINVKIIPPTEASVISMPTPVSGCGLGVDTVSIVIKNTGADTLNTTLTASYQANGGAVVNEQVTLTNFAPNQNVTHVFSALLDMATVNVDSIFDIKGWIALTGDPLQFNDTVLSTVVSSYVPADPIVSTVTINYGQSATINVTSQDSLYWFADMTATTSLFAGNPYVTPILFDTTIYYVEAMNGMADLKITEIVHFKTGAGQTPAYPAWCVGEDLVEITNLGSAPVNLQGYVFDVFGEGARTYTFPSVQLQGGQVLVLHIGSGTDNPANNYYNTGGGNDIILSISISGYVLRDNAGSILDVVSANNYTFLPPSGVTPADWSGSLTTSNCGPIRILSDNNTASDWIAASSTTTQTMGTINPQLAGSIGTGGNGCKSNRVPVTVNVNMPAVEAEIVEILTPVQESCTEGNEGITIRIKNNGTQTINSGLTATYRIDSNTPVSEVVSTPIPSGGTIDFTFATPFTFTLASSDTTFSLLTYVNHAGDPYLLNDTASTSIKLLFTPNPPVATSPVTIPYGTSTTITATSPQQMKWFDLPTGGIELGTGANFTTPILYDTTIFYVEANNTILGQQTTVGTGTLTSYQLPTNPFYDYSWAGSFYKASELNFTGLIDTIMYNVSSTISNYLQLDQRIYMIQVPDSFFTSTAKPDPTTMTQVFQGDVTWNGPGWVKLPLQTAFNYDGTSNLIIYWENWDGDYVSPYPSFYYTVASANISTFAYADVTFPSGSGSLTTTRPNVLFSHSVQGCPSNRIPVQVNLSGVPANDAGIVSVDAPVSPTGFGSQPIVVSLHNYGAANLTNVTINWTVNGVPQAPYAWVGTLANGQTLPNVTIGTYNFTLGYHNFKVWTTDPNGSADIYNLNDTAMATIQAYEPLNGIYTIGGTTPDFPTFTAARNALIEYGVSGPVTFKARSGIYTEKMFLPAYVGASATNTVTFMPDTNATVTLTTADTFVVKIMSAAYYIFDGSNNGTNSRDFNIINTATSGTPAAVWIAGGTNFITIKNCKIANGTNTLSTSIGILAGGNTVGMSSTGQNNNLTIHNNEIVKAYIALLVKAAGAAKSTNVLITNNTIGSVNTPEYIYYRGIDLQGDSLIRVEGNKIFNIKSATSLNVAGVEIGQDTKDAIITRNEIHSLYSTSTGGYGAYGVNINSGTNVNNIEISNNFIYDIVTANYSNSSTTWNPFGIRLTGGSNVKVWHNTINLYGAPTAGSNPSMSASIIVLSTSLTGLDVRNNIFANSMTGLPNSKAYSIYIVSGVPFSKIDYNDYYASGPFGIFGFSGASDILNLASWKLVTIKDTNSLSVNPSFLTNSDLHTFSTSVNGKATPITGVTVDFDGDVRNITTPDMGADEFDPLDNDLGVIAVVSPASNCGLSANQVIAVQVKNNGQNPVTAFTISYTLNGGTPVTENFSGSLATDSTHTFTFATTADMSAISPYTLVFQVTLTGDQYALNNTLTHTLPAIHDFANAYTMGFETTENFAAWTTLNVLNDASRWVIPFNSATYAQTGTFSAQFLNNSSTTGGNDWMFSPCFQLEGNKTYKLEFWYRVESATYPHNIKVMFGSDDTPFAMTDTLIVLNGFTNTGHVKASAIVNVATTGTYYFGWHAYSNASSFYAYVDNINIKLLAPKDAGVVEFVNVTPIMNGGDALNLEARIKNFGGDTLFSIPVKYSLNGGTPVTETWMGTLLPDSTVVHTFATAFNIPDNSWDLCAWTQLTNDGNNGNDTLCDQLFGIPLVTIPFEDDFEGADFFYIEGLNNQWQHGVPSASVINTAHSPVNVWATNLTGNYANSSNYNLYSPRISFVNIVNAEVGFWHYYDAETTFDGGRLQFTTNNGNTWQTLGSVGDPLGANWYTHSNINGAPAFSGQSSGWVYSSYNLAQFNNFPVPVQFRFNFFANSSNNANGWAIDDFEIFQNQIPEDAGVLAIVTPTGSVVTGSSQTVEVTIKNYGTNALTSIPVRYRINNGVPVAEQWTGNLAPGATTNFTFTAPVVQTADYSLCAWTRVPTDSYTQNDTACTSITIIPAQYDAGIIEITTPGTTSLTGSPTTVTVKIKNFGSEPLTSIPVQYDINSGTPTTDTYTGTLNPGAEVLFTFTQTYVSPSGNYMFCAKTNLTTDQNATNDKICKTVTGTVGIDDNNTTTLQLGQNTPNPATNKTFVPYMLPERGTARFELVNVIGQVVFSTEEEKPAGRHVLEINTQELPDGVYFYTLMFNEQRLTRKLVVNK